MTIFEKIIAREIPAKIVWEDDDAIAFHDVNPQAPVHVLIVPKKVIPRLAAATESNQKILGNFCSSPANSRRSSASSKAATASSSTAAPTRAKAFRICTFICSANARWPGRPG